ncbi:MAG: Cytosol aminopeptidase PepA, partial [uncultured Thermomicrobiales bacterium]
VRRRRRRRLPPARRRRQAAGQRHRYLRRHREPAERLGVQARRRLQDVQRHDD